MAPVESMAPVGSEMNEIPRAPRPTTRHADGVAPVSWTGAESACLAELGFFGEDDRIEPIGSSRVPMSPNGDRHDILCGALHTCGHKDLQREFDYHPEPGWH